MLRSCSSAIRGVARSSPKRVMTPRCARDQAYGAGSYVVLTLQGFRDHFGQDLASDETALLHATQGPFAQEGHRAEARGKNPRAVFQSPSHAFPAIRGRGFYPGGSEPTELGRVSGSSIRGAHHHFRLEKGRA